VLLDRLLDLAAAGAALRDAPDPGAAFFAYLDRLAEEAGPKRDLFDALASGGGEAGPAVLAAAADVRAHVTGLFDQARQVGDVRPDIGHDELTALLAGLLFAIRPQSGANQALVLSVFRDGLRPRLLGKGPSRTPGCLRGTKSGDRFVTRGRSRQECICVSWEIPSSHCGR